MLRCGMVCTCRVRGRPHPAASVVVAPTNGGAQRAVTAALWYDGTA
jgi:hypothetical protein